MKATTWTALAALLIVSMTGCSSSHQAAQAADGTTTTAATDNTTTAAAADPASPAAEAATTTADTSSGDKTGAGHVSLTGQYSLEHDFAVDACQVAPPGDGLLSGYHMASKDGEPPIGMIAISLKDYTKDGAYVQAASSPEAAVGQAMKTGVMGVLTLMVMKDATTPLAFMQAPDSKLTITVSNEGAKGTAEFTDLESQLSMADIDPSSSAKPHGKRVSGSITWTCGSVDHLNAKMNDAVNGMFKKLIPPR